MEPKPFPGCRTTAVLVLLFVAAVEVTARWLGQPAPGSLILPSFVSTPGWSALPLLAVMVPPKEWSVLVRTALASTIVAFAALYFTLGAEAARHLCAGFALGVTPYAALLWLAATRTGEARRWCFSLLAAASIVHVSSLAMPFFMANSVRLLPTIYDADLIGLDAAFGLQPSSLASILLARSPLLSGACYLVYGLLPVGVAIVAALEERGPRRPQLGLLPAFVVAAVVGYACYCLMPAVGPGPFFGPGFSVLSPDLATIARRTVDTDPEHVRNAMPSLHTTWAVLMLLSTRELTSRIRSAAVVFLALTLLATLGLGEHYAIDLVLAMPLVLTVRALCVTELPWARRERWAALASGVLVLLGWCMVIRGHASSALPGALSLALMAGTVLVSIRLETGLYHAGQRDRVSLNPAQLAPSLRAGRWRWRRIVHVSS